MRPILRDLGNVAARTGAAIVIIGHMNKGEKSKGIYRGLGSIDITAAARSVLLIGKRKDDPNTRFITQIKNNLTEFGRSVSISEEDLLSTTLSKKTKYEVATEMITALLADGDKKSNDIYNACMTAGIASATMQYVKKRMGIKSVRKIDDWYWTLNSDGEDTDDGEDFEVSESDETPVTFVDNINNIPDSPTDIEPSLFMTSPPAVTMPSPFGELTLIDWRAY